MIFKIKKFHNEISIAYKAIVKIDKSLFTLIIFR